MPDEYKEQTSAYSAVFHQSHLSSGMETTPCDLEVQMLIESHMTGLSGHRGDAPIVSALHRAMDAA